MWGNAGRSLVVVLCDFFGAIPLGRFLWGDSFGAIPLGRFLWGDSFGAIAL